MATREELEQAILAMEPREVDRLRREALWKREAELAKAARSPHPVGTILMDLDDCGHSVMWVRVAGKTWEPWFRDTHGNDVGDHQLNWKDLPVVGAMPQAWTDDQLEDEEYADDDA